MTDTVLERPRPPPSQVHLPVYRDRLVLVPRDEPIPFGVLSKKSARTNRGAAPSKAWAINSPAGVAASCAMESNFFSRFLMPERRSFSLSRLISDLAQRTVSSESKPRRISIPSDTNAGRRTGCSTPAQSIAPLLLTRLTIIVSVHLCVRTMLQEVSSFCARCHLRAMGAPIACELLACGFRVLSRCSSNRLSSIVAAAADHRIGAGITVQRIVGTVPGQHVC